MRTLGLLFALATLSLAADQDYNGRWDIVVHKAPAEILSTTTKAWWLGIEGAGTPEIKLQFVGSPDGSLDDIPDAKIENGVLHYAWKRTNPQTKATTQIDYEVKYVNGVLEGKMSGPKETLTFTGHRAPVINEHDDGSWVKGKPIV